jgi:membrane-associated phospholipid phosphatase
MKLSWSKKLFLKINRELGKNEVRDFIFLYMAHWLIYFLGFVVLQWASNALDLMSFKIFVKLILTASIFGFVGNSLLAFIWRHPRPHKELQVVKLLFSPVENWKSFPSDHATVSFIFVFITFLFHPPLWLAFLVFALAILISTARVYAGVHYPRDIVAGFFFAFIYSAISFWILQYISQPLYNYFINLL